METQLKNDDYQQLLIEINNTEDHLQLLKQRLKTVKDLELKKISDLFFGKFGFSIQAFILNIESNGSYINYGYLHKYLGDDYEDLTDKLVDIGFLNIHYMFFDQENESNEIELSKADYVEFSTPNESGNCLDPLLGESCSPSQFKARSYKFASTTQNYTDFILQNSSIFNPVK